MDLRFGEAYEGLRQKTQAFCSETWPLSGDEGALPEREQIIAWRKKAIVAGLLHRTVPKAYGGGGEEPDVLAETVIRQELDAADVPHRGSVQGTHMLVPTLLECGTEAQRERYIRPTLCGELRWCQGYSEPGSGSDLASLQSRAVLDGDTWVLNGQKIWTTQADEAEMMFGLFRSEPEAQKHAGISYFIFPMDTPGIDPRPLKMMNGGIDFCEVFFNDVRIPKDSIVGERGAGWKVSRSTLKHERMLIGDATGVRMQFDALLALAKQAGRSSDASIRQRLAEIEGYVATQEYAVARMLTAIHKGEDMKAASEMMMAKLFSTDTGQRIAKLALDLLREKGLTEPAGDDVVMGVRPYDEARWISQYMFSLAGAIAGGASNVQRNIIGERLLGLPRDQRPPGH
jgi:alkylation response protein AidB-like acyl-CoA dehydrogenase